MNAHTHTHTPAALQYFGRKLIVAGISARKRAPSVVYSFTHYVRAYLSAACTREIPLRINCSITHRLNAVVHYYCYFTVRCNTYNIAATLSAQHKRVYFTNVVTRRLHTILYARMPPNDFTSRKCCDNVIISQWRCNKLPTTTSFKRN